jgi:hypothetical protein
MRTISRPGARAGILPLMSIFLTFVFVVLVAPSPAMAEARLGGTVESAGSPLGHFVVSLYATRDQGLATWSARDRARAISGGEASARLLGRTITDRSGRFAFVYDEPESESSVLYLLAHRGPIVLASALGPKRLAPNRVVVNERTTVATGFAFAQFISGLGIAGNTIGVRNASSMLRNLVDVASGEPSPVLTISPNGLDNDTWRTFNALANTVASCVAQPPRCEQLFLAARSLQGLRATNTLQAMANLAGYPGQSQRTLFQLSEAGRKANRPVLESAPDAWTLILRFEGEVDENGNAIINGPGNFAIDAEGTLWVSNNYAAGKRTDIVCAGQNLLRFRPNGTFFPGSPYTGGGVSGAGYGITSDLEGNIWIGNFGFQAPECVGTPAEALHNSVSKFAPDGEALSPDGLGYTEGLILWPQGTVADRKGNIWIANCGNDSVTLYPEGDHKKGRNLDLAPLGVIRPFDIAIDHYNRAWVTGNGSNSVVVLDANGTPTLGSPLKPEGVTRPLGVAVDSRGNIWVANSNIVAVPCNNDAIKLPRREDGGTVTLFQAKGRSGAIRTRTFEGGGMAIPWGITVDGNDNVWVANFGGGDDTGGSYLSRISQICGTNTANCPPRARTGTPISPETGYTSTALSRVTAVAVDPSGNLWATDNWQFVPEQNNPGGNAVVAFVGIAAPIETPLIGPPVPAR